MQHALLQQIVGALKRVKVAANSFEVTASSRRAVHAPAAKKEKPRVTRAKSLLEGNDRALEEAFSKVEALEVNASADSKMQNQLASRKTLMCDFMRETMSVPQNS